MIYEGCLEEYHLTPKVIANAKHIGQIVWDFVHGKP